MLSRIQIKNYKSIKDLSIELGRVNLFMGENGSGKSNILEAIALAAAAEANKLDNEFLNHRGIRVTKPELMQSAFEVAKSEYLIEIIVYYKVINRSWCYKLTHDVDEPYAPWKDENIEYVKQFQQEGFEILKSSKSENGSITKESVAEIGNIMEKIDSETKLERKKFQSFLVFSIENKFLRKFHADIHTEPLGISGEGLFRFLTLMKTREPEKLEIILKELSVFSWFKNLTIEEDLRLEQVNINDKFTQLMLDQRSTNEGFLFVLFYLALLVSKDTPAIFAIDNMDASLNPKLCTRIIQKIVELSKQFDKQVFLTAHNPAVLDGIDLGDPEQRLFMVSRNRQGHTRLKHITLQEKPKAATGEELKLSEAMMRGYLGGLPKEF